MVRLYTTLAALLLLAGSQAVAQAQSSGSDAVIVRGTIRPKPAPEIAPPPLELFVAPPRVEQIALSPDGSRFAFVTHKGGMRLLTTYVVADGSSQVIKLSEDPLSALIWLDNDHVVLSNTQTGARSTCPSGLDNTLKAAQALSDLGFAMSAVPDLDPTLVLRLQNQLTPPPCASYGVRSHDAATIVNLKTRNNITLGNHLSGDYNHMALGLPRLVTIDGKPQLTGAFLELRDKPIGGQVAQRVYLWRVDPDTGRGRIVDDRGGDLDRTGSYVDDWMLDDAGKPVVRASYSYFDTTFAIETLKGGKWTPILKRKIERLAKTNFAPSLAGLGRDGQSLLILDAVDASDGARSFHYYELSADGKLSEALNKRDATRDRPIFHPQTGALAGFEHDGEVTTYTFFDADLAEYYKLALEMAPDKTVRLAALAKDMDQMILFTQGGDDAGSWHYYDFATSKRVDIGDDYPSLPDEWVASQRQVKYKARDGMEIRAVVTLPPQGEAKTRALVVLPHDGPLGHDRRSYNWLAQVLASRGYVVLQPNYRGSDGYDMAYTNAGYGEWSGRMLNDMADGVSYLAGEGMVDASRVCIAGEGYGGYAALAGATKGSPYRCAAAINGIVDPEGYADHLKDGDETDAMAALKADPEHPRAFRVNTASPSLAQRYFGDKTPEAISAASVDAPVLLVTAKYNKIVPASQSRALRDKLQAAGKANTYVEPEDCVQDLSAPTCKLEVAQAMVDFLAKYNPAR
jgi:dipeptidyl aminopeptidase/acylaminoacyl peptidase